MIKKTPTQDCPSADELRGYLHPLASQREDWDRHMESCLPCRATLERLAADASWWTESHDLLNPNAESRPAHDPQISRIIDSVCALSLQADQDSQSDPLREFEIEQLQRLIQPPSHPELLGRIGRYELEQLVGRGGMGLVFRARDTELHRVVAVKTLAVHLLPIGVARERFIREARASAALVHPHIVPVHDVITEGAVPALVMQYVAGPTLAGWLTARGPLPWQDVLQLGIQLTDALSTAHAHGLVHRDIKPGNVLLEADGSRALLTDFGLVRALDDATLTRSGMLAGTPDYMSPEQASGRQIDGRSDLFSLGCMLYAMLSGHPPFQAADPMAVLNRICHSRHRSLTADHPHIPWEISRMVDRLLSKDARHRPGTGEEVREHMQRLTQSRLQLRRKWSARPVVAVALGLICLLSITWGIATIWTNESQRSWQPAYGVDIPPVQEPLDRSAFAESPSVRRDSAASAGFADLRAIDAQIQALDRQSRLLANEYAWPTVAEVMADELPSEHADRQIHDLSADIYQLERELFQSDHIP